MSSPQGDSYDSHARKRVGKACDRCRLKKSKCDGSYPCSRCKMDNAICAFGDRKRSQDRVFPKGYPEMLEFQQGQIVSAVRKMYTMLLREGQWPGAPLKETDGHPLTHDILERLGILEDSSESPVTTPATFEDDVDSLRKRVETMNRRGFSHQQLNSTHSDTESDLHDSPSTSPSTRTASVSSSFSSRKRSPSNSTSYDAKSALPNKHVKYERSTQLKQLPQQSTTPFVVGTDYSISPAFDFSGLDASAYEPDYLLYDSVSFPLELGASSLANLSTFDNLSTLPYDPEYDTFQHSGFQDLQSFPAMA